MAVSTHTLQIQTAGHCDIRDLTSAVVKAVISSSIRDGIVNVFCPGSTGGVTTIEYESGALDDLRQLFDEIVPENRKYLHNLRWGDGNGHSHLRAALLGPSLVVPLVDGQLLLGTWQQIILVDFDNRQRNRKIIVQIVGE